MLRLTVVLFLPPVAKGTLKPGYPGGAEGMSPRTLYSPAPRAEILWGGFDFCLLIFPSFWMEIAFLEPPWPHTGIKERAKGPQPCGNPRENLIGKLKEDFPLRVEEGKRCLH